MFGGEGRWILILTLLWENLAMVDTVQGAPQTPIMLRSDFIFFADTLDCLVFFLLPPSPRSPCMIRSDDSVSVR